MKKIIITAGTLILVGVAILIGVLLYGSQKSANKSRQLIIYFTLSGNTKKPPRHYNKIRTLILFGFALKSIPNNV